jgi:hypothetical protein
MRWLAAVLALACGCEKKEAPPPPPPDPLDAIQLPEVTGAGAVAVASPSPLVIASPSAVAVAGTQIIALRDGLPDPADQEGGALGMKVPKLSTKLGALPRASALAVAIDRRLGYRLLIQLLFSAKQQEAGWKKFDVLVRAGGKLMAIPIALPDKTPADVARLDEDGSLTADTVLRTIQTSYMAGIKRCYNDLRKTDAKAGGKLALALNITETGRLRDSTVHGFAPSLDACISRGMTSWQFPIPREPSGTPTAASFRITLRLTSDDATTPPEPSQIAAPPRAAPADPPLKLAVAVTRTEVLLWSLSGLEGTLKDPKLKLPLGQIARLTPALAEIAARRWSGRAVPPDSQTIIVMADGSVSLQTVAEVCNAVRATPAGTPLFPDIALSMGFE